MKVISSKLCATMVILGEGLDNLVVAHHASIVFLPEMGHLGKKYIGEELYKFGLKLLGVARKDNATKIKNDTLIVAHNSTNVGILHELCKQEPHFFDERLSSGDEWAVALEE